MDKAKYEDSQYPVNAEVESLLRSGFIRRSQDFRLNKDQTVAVSTHTYWNHDMNTCPRGVTVQLLGAGGVAVYGSYNNEDFWCAWCALPRRRKE